MARRRNIKRDRRGRFAKIAGMKGSSSVKRVGTNKSPGGTSPTGTNKTRPARTKRQRNIRRAAIAVTAVRAAGTVAAGYGVYKASTFEERRARTTMNMQQAADSLSRGLPSIHIPKRSRRGVYNITSL